MLCSYLSRHIEAAQGDNFIAVRVDFVGPNGNQWARISPKGVTADSIPQPALYRYVAADAVFYELWQLSSPDLADAWAKAKVEADSGRRGIETFWSNEA